MKKVEPLIDEGLRVSLVETAFFDGDIEIPHIDAPDKIVIPEENITERIRHFSGVLCHSL